MVLPATLTKALGWSFDHGRGWQPGDRAPQSGFWLIGDSEIQLEAIVMTLRNWRNAAQGPRGSGLEVRDQISSVRA